MIKILALILALMFVAVPLASCGGDNADTTADAADTTSAYNVEAAAAYLKNMYKQYLAAPETAKDFTLVSQVMNDGVAYTVAWTTNVESVKVVADEANKQVTIDVNEKTPEEIKYDLKATVTDPAGGKAELTFKLVVPAYGATVLEGTAYKFYFTQVVTGKVLYIDGGISENGRYLTMTEDFASAIDVFAEESGSGYKFYTTIDGAKKYINAFTNDEGKTCIGYADASDSVYTYNSSTFAWETELDGVAYYIGTYSNFETVSISKTSYITVENTRVSQFPLELTTEAVEFEGTVPPAETDAATDAPSASDTTTAPTPSTGNSTTAAKPDAPAEDKTVGTATKVSAVKDGGKYVIYLANDGIVIGTAAAGKDKNKLEDIATSVANDKITVTDKMAVFTLNYKEGDTFYLVANGKYLTAGETGNSLTLASSATAYSEWVLETADGGWYIKNVNAAYSGKAQYIEFYYDFTTYGLNTTNPAIYTFTFFEMA